MPIISSMCYDTYHDVILTLTEGVPTMKSQPHLNRECTYYNSTYSLNQRTHLVSCQKESMAYSCHPEEFKDWLTDLFRLEGGSHRTMSALGTLPLSESL